MSKLSVKNLVDSREDGDLLSPAERGGTRMVSTTAHDYDSDDGRLMVIPWYFSYFFHSSTLFMYDQIASLSQSLFP